jgi:dUTP pyrophosphatase
MSKLALRVKKLSEHATIPVRASARAAGYDLFAAYDTSIDAHGKALVKTDISLAIPNGHYGRIAPRSSLAWKNHIDVGAGVIDEDYRGPLGVVLFNHANEPFEIKRGDRIAQLIIEVIAHPEIEEVMDLDDTDRGQGGFGSTGTSGVSASKAAHVDVATAN